jgi:hypothetical protein
MIDAQDKAGRCTLRYIAALIARCTFFPMFTAYANSLMQAQHGLYEAFPLLMLLFAHLVGDTRQAGSHAVLHDAA